MIKTFGLTHIALPVTDLERSVRFYQALLGAEIIYCEGGDAVDISTPGCHDVITPKGEARIPAEGKWISVHLVATMLSPCIRPPIKW